MMPNLITKTNALAMNILLQICIQKESHLHMHINVTYICYLAELIQCLL